MEKFFKKYPAKLIPIAGVPGAYFVGEEPSKEPVDATPLKELLDLFPKKEEQNLTPLTKRFRTLQKLIGSEAKRTKFNLSTILNDLDNTNNTKEETL